MAKATTKVARFMVIEFWVGGLCCQTQRKNSKIIKHC